MTCKLSKRPFKSFQSGDDTLARFEYEYYTETAVGKITLRLFDAY